MNIERAWVSEGSGKLRLSVTSKGSIVYLLDGQSRAVYFRRYEFYESARAEADAEQLASFANATEVQLTIDGATVAAGGGVIRDE